MPSVRRSWIAVLCGMFLLAPPCQAQEAQRPAKLSLAMVLPRDPLAASSSGANFFAGRSGDRVAYNTQMAATGALVFADDSGLYKTLQGRSENRSLTDLAHAFNHLGDLTYVAPALGLVYLSGGKENQHLVWQAGMAVLKAGIIGVVLKEAVGRKRPKGRDGGDGDTFRPFSFNGDDYQSFPSGHALVAFSVATVWAHDKPREKDLAYALATAVGLSRIYSHAHWPADVFWGAVLGVSQARQVLRGNTNLLTFKF
ncbi:MAG TPA: phosphatase PAP2 family protein [Capsulimonadaceae bacterium]|nr:phosphatase PAP2 family protein [Capsulimonadaceae bacterium]